jgi:hypothetical protein
MKALRMEEMTAPAVNDTIARGYATVVGIFDHHSGFQITAEETCYLERSLESFRYRSICRMNILKKRA